MISLNAICKTYKASDTETKALDNIELEINEGEFVAIMGPSGCGKSTLLNVIGMIDAPEQGSYVFDGIEVVGRSESQLVDLRKKNIGFIFQSFNLIDDLTVYENIELPLLYNDIPKQRRQTQVREALELVDLSHRAKHKPRQLSGGQQQRIAIARAVVTDPRLILADEPTGNLDTRNGDDVMQMLSVLNQQGATIVMVTHSSPHSKRAGRVIHMLDGKIQPAPQVHVRIESEYLQGKVSPIY